MLKNPTVKLQGKMAACDILHACAFIFYFKKWTKIQSVSIWKLFGLSLPQHKNSNSVGVSLQKDFFLC